MKLRLFLIFIETYQLDYASEANNIAKIRTDRSMRQFTIYLVQFILLRNLLHTEIKILFLNL